MVTAGHLSFECVLFDSKRWYEVDSLNDLRQSEKIHWQFNLDSQKSVYEPVTGIPIPELLPI